VFRFSLLIHQITTVKFPWLLLVLLPFFVGRSATSSESHTPGLSFILHVQAGLTAYASLADELDLDYVRPLFQRVDVDAGDFLLGTYQLAGRTAVVNLVTTTAGWVIAYHSPDYAVQHLYDCVDLTSDLPNQLERALLEIATALESTDVAISYYDFRYPNATRVTLHAAYIPQSGNLTTTVNLPLANAYIERGYVFCTALSNSRLLLNGEFIDQQGSVSQVVRRYGTLRHDQLRAGQTNTMRIEALSLFGAGFFAGVATSYSGNEPLIASGGMNRTLELLYPSMIGEPLTISRVYLPAVVK
jgi:hypothetical protein